MRSDGISRYVFFYKYCYCTAVILNPIFALFLLNYISPGRYSQNYSTQLDDYLLRRLPLHFIILILNIISWKFYVSMTKIGTFLEKMLSIGRLIMAICGASIAFAFIPMEGPLADILWTPLFLFLAKLPLIYFVICILIVVLEILYFKKL